MNKNFPAAICLSLINVIGLNIAIKVLSPIFTISFNKDSHVNYLQKIFIVDNLYFTILVLGILFISLLIWLGMLVRKKLDSKQIASTLLMSFALSLSMELLVMCTSNMLTYTTF